MYEEHFLKQDITLNPRLPPQIPEPQGMPQAEFIIATCLRTGGFIGKPLPAHCAVMASTPRLAVKIISIRKAGEKRPATKIWQSDAQAAAD